MDLVESAPVRHIALAVGSFGDGGVERALTRLAAELSGPGRRVDIYVGNPLHPYVLDLPAAVRVLPFREPDDLVRGLAAAAPEVILTGKLADDRAALDARDRLGLAMRVVATVGTPLSASLSADGRNPLRAWRRRREVRADYRRLDAITAVSEAVAADLRRHFAAPEVPLAVVPNPLVPTDVEARAAAPCPHPWLAPGAPPVIIAVGGLRRVKDFATLLRAVAALATAPAARLLVLGEGRERRPLTRLARRLGIAERVDLHGFVPDPLPYIARAAVLVLSSRREGLPGVLVEAMAVGTPVVATDCPGGVRGLLDGGRLGPLVPVGDHRALAAAITATLAAPPEPRRLRQAAAPYAAAASARAYLDLFARLIAAPRA